MNKLIIVLFAALLSTPAFAVDLTLDQTPQITMPDGKTQKTRAECEAYSETPPFGCIHEEYVQETVGTEIQFVLGVSLLDPSGRGNDPKNPQAGNLAIRLYGVDKPVLKADEITLILSRVDRVEDPVTIARMHAFLEPSKPDNPTK